MTSSSGPAPRTVPDVVNAALRADASRPLVTFYDDATGERIELSVTTYANWVAKTAGLLQDELDAERGGLVLVDLPVHWQGAVWLGAAWALGMRVTDDTSAAGDADVVVCGPDGVAGYAPYAGGAAVVALSLRPLGARFAEPLPDGVVDYGAVVLGQPDVFVPYDPPAPDDEGWADGSTQAELVAQAVASGVVAEGGRLLTDVACTSRAGAATLLAPLALGGGTVWVRHPDDARWEAKAGDERATATLRA